MQIATPRTPSRTEMRRSGCSCFGRRATSGSPATAWRAVWGSAVQTPSRAPNWYSFERFSTRMAGEDMDAKVEEVEGFKKVEAVKKVEWGGFRKDGQVWQRPSVRS